MNGLQENKDYFSAGGVIGRWDFFVNNFLYSLGIMAVSVVVGFIVGSFMPKPVAILTTSSFLFVNFYFAFLNCFKRLRDIRGTTENQGAHQVALTIAFFVPIVGTIAQFWLMLAPGMITNAPDRELQTHSPDQFENAA